MGRAKQKSVPLRRNDLRGVCRAGEQIAIELRVGPEGIGVLQGQVLQQREEELLENSEPGKIAADFEA